MPDSREQNKETPRLSVVVPVFNEAPNLETLAERVTEVTRELPGKTEVLLVDDGSTDGSPDILRRVCARYPEARALLFRRNFGQSAAMTAGFQHARGDIVVSMDGDLQNDPRDIPRMLAKLAEGFDVVCGWRKKRQDAFLSRRLPSLIANRLIGLLTGVRLHDYGCSLKVYRRELVENLILYGELHRFIPVLVSLQGARTAEMEVGHHPRAKGESKYGIGRLPKVLLDLFMMYYFQRFATRPLHFFGRGGALLFALGFIIECYLTFVKLALGEDIGARPLLLLGALLIITGVMLGGIGLLAELVVRTYYETSGKRIYFIREIIS